MCSPPKPTRSCTELSHGLTTLRTACSTLTLRLVWRCWHCQWLSSSQWRQRVEFCTFAPDLYMYMCVCVCSSSSSSSSSSDYRRFRFHFDMLTCKLPKRFPKHNCHIHIHTQRYLTPMLLWCGIYFTQAHKEERFLFPIYPLFCVAAASTLVTVTEQFGTWIQPLKRVSRGLATVTVLVYALLSVSRGIAIIQSYHAPLDVYAALPPDAAGDVCVGKEWHRFPTSFFLPPKARLRFIKSEFDGLLPKAFSETPDGYSAIPTYGPAPAHALSHQEKK